MCHVIFHMLERRGWGTVACLKRPQSKLAPVHGAPSQAPSTVSTRQCQGPNKRGYPEGLEPPLTKAGPHITKNRASRLGVGRRDAAWRKSQVQRGRPGPARGLGPLFYRGYTLAAAGQPHNYTGRGKLDMEFFLRPTASLKDEGGREVPAGCGLIPGVAVAYGKRGIFPRASFSRAVAYGKLAQRLR